MSMKMTSSMTAWAACGVGAALALLAREVARLGTCEAGRQAPGSWLNGSMWWAEKMEI